VPSLRDITGNWFSDPLLVIADKQLRGASHINKFGHNTCIAGCTQEDIWDNGSTYIYPTQARIHDLTSASCNDTACGTGARTIRVMGLDECYNEIEEDVTMAGTCASPTQKKYLRIYRMYVLTAGSNEGSVGKISATAQVDGTVSAVILEDNGNQTHMAIYTVPNGKTGYITQIYGSIGRKQSASYSLDLKIRPLGGVFNTNFTIDGNSTGNSKVIYEPKPYIIVPAKSDIKISADSSLAGADMTAGFDVILL